MAGDREVDQLADTVRHGGLVAQLRAGKALLQLDDVAGLDVLVNETELGRYYERAVLGLERHAQDPRAIEALRRAATHEPVGESIVAQATNKRRRRAAAQALEHMGIETPVASGEMTPASREQVPSAPERGKRYWHFNLVYCVIGLLAYGGATYWFGGERALRAALPVMIGALAGVLVVNLVSFLVYVYRYVYRSKQR